MHPKTRWRKGESVRTGWRGTRTSVLEVTDFGALGDLFAELAVAGGAASGPSWVLDPVSPVHDEARRLAAEDARRRADAYAAALGLGVIAVAWIAEPGLRETTGAGGGLPVGAARMVSAQFGIPAEEVIEVIPEEMEVEAQVDVGFAFGVVAG